MRLTLMCLFLPILVVGQNTGVLVISNSNGRLIFADSSILPSKITGLATLLNVKATTTELNTKMNIWYAADAQASDSYVITLSPIPASYTTGMMIVFKANTANTTGCTINVNGLGVKDITKRVSTALSTGDILQGMLCWLVYDGTRFIILNPVVN